MPTIATPDAKTLELNLGRETTYGVAPASYVRTYVYSYGVKPDKPLEDDRILGVGLTTARDQSEPAPGLVSLAGSVEVPLDMRHLGYWLTLLFGDAVKTGTGPYQHVFTSGAASLPTATIASQIGGSGPRQDTGLVARSGRFAPAAEAGFRRVTLDLAGKDRTYPGSLSITPPTPPVRAPMPSATGILKIDGSQAAKVLAFDGTYANGFEEERYLDGAATVSGFAPGQNDAKWSGSMRVRWMDSTLEAQAAAGTPSSVEMVYQLSASLKLSLLSANVVFQRSGPDIGAPGRIEQTLAWRAHQTGAAAMLVATLTNDVATGYLS